MAVAFLLGTGEVKAMEKKFELTSDTKDTEFRQLYRIKALIDFGDVKAGDLGGFVEKEENLSHSDDAWVYGNARVYGNALVSFWYREDFCLTSTDNFIFKNSWSSLRDFFYNPATKMWSVGCFFGTSDELIKKAYADSEKSGRMYERYVRFAESLAAEEEVRA